MGIQEYDGTKEIKAAYGAAYKAIGSGDASRTRKLVAEYPFLVTNERLGVDDDPLLNQAIMYGTRCRSCVEVVETILNLGADVNFCPPWRCTALYDAVLNHEVVLVKLLLKRGANPNLIEFPGDEEPYETVLDHVKIEIFLQESPLFYEPDRDPGEVMPLIRNILVQAGAKQYHELLPQDGCD